MAKYEEHQFYCLLCGRAGIPIRRKVGHQHSALHRKRLYCPFCKIEVNHMEVRNQVEKAIFIENFKNGVYHDEAETSRVVCGSSWQW